MSWALGFDSQWNRDIGYGVPAFCDHPGCNAEIDRGLAHVCGAEPYGGEEGCGLYFCSKHQSAGKQLCERCAEKQEPFFPKPDHPKWIAHKLNDPSWEKWRVQNPKEVADMQNLLAARENQPQPKDDK